MWPNEELFPRLPNDVTLARIVPKLPWTAFHRLAAVSRSWRKVILGHHVHDERIRSCSTDTLVVHGHDHDKPEHGVGDSKFGTVAVYSVRDKKCYDLPAIPGHYRGLPFSCACVSLDGKIYVLGGAVKRSGPNPRSKVKADTSNSSSKVYVLDLAWASHWKECASMERGRQAFGCTVLNGKIYVFGGTKNHEPVLGAEVYNPEVDAWSPIAPMASLRFGHRVSTVAQEILVHGGEYYHPSYLSLKANGEWDSAIERNPWSFEHFTYPATSVEAYNPVKDQWTVDNRMDEVHRGPFDSDNLFVAQHKFHLMQDDCISVAQDDGSWTILELHELPGMLWRMVVKQTVAVELLNNELLAGVEWYDEEDPRLMEAAIFQSEGFGTKNRQTIWNVVSRCPGVFNFMYCIQL